MSYDTNVQPKPSFTQRSIVNTGLLLALFSVIFALIPSVTNLYGNKVLSGVITLASYLITIGILVNAIKKYRDDELGGYMSFGNGFLFVFFACIISGIITSIFSYIQLTFIDPGMMQEALNEQMAQMEKQGLTEEQMEVASSVTNIFRSPAILSLFAFLGQLVAGAILGAILGAIFQKNPPFQKQNQ